MTGSDPNSVPSDLDKSPAPWHGLATNLAYPIEERWKMALKACDLYEVQHEETVRRYTAMMLNLSQLAAETARALEPFVMALADFQAAVHREVNGG